ncbi:ubiquitin-conjugating enzyme E2 29-like [Eutrema salsugineum]|uniref:ubiquitin-conjugating enzyme E2 29-like n=1 Tax=Eutrema salsugineum TaxID=72664 RepID=UPI000CED1EA4|nr:ubiquitin-conjugating enzyme E2 29-like [Eutrema salsugineum]
MTKYWERAITIQQKEIDRVKSLLYRAGPIDGKLSYWEAVIFGPAESPYSGGVFKVFFTTKLFHPNVGERGHIFLRLLTIDHFSPIHTIHTILSKLHEMLTNPEIGEGDYYDEAKAKLYKEDKAGFDQRARECTLEHAGP